MKLRRILALLLALTMLLSLGSTALAAKPAVKHITRSRTSYTYYTDEQLREMLGGISQEDLNALKTSAYDAVMQNQAWDVYSYGFQYTNAVYVDALANLIFLNPELFFISDLSYSYYSNGNIGSFTPIYDYGYETAMEQHKELATAAQEILCRFQRSDLSDLELALLVHDYLAANYEYHTPTADQNLQHPIGKYTAYNLLVEGTAVCQGYAEAYAYLMMQFGINCGLCSSDALNHAWNIIELDGKEYHVDVTWDDPSVDRIGYARHINFLRSTAGMVDSGHTANDFTGNPTNTEYDSAFWQDSKAAFCLFEGTIYYINTSGWLCSWVDGVSTELYKLNQRWVIDEDGRAYVDCLSILATDGENLLFSTPKEILRYLPETNTTEVVYSYSDAEKPYHNIYGFQVRDNDLRILICNTLPSTEEEALANTITYKYRDTAVDLHEYDEGTVVTPATCQTEGQMLYSCIYCGAEKTENIGIGDHLWAAATCTEPSMCSLCGEIRMGEEGFRLVASPDELQAGDQIVIAVIVDGAYKAMPLTLSSGKFVPTDLTVENGKVTSAEPPVWTIAPVEGGGYCLYNGSSYLAYNSSTNFKTASTPYAWGMEAGSNGGYIMNSTQTTRGIYYQFESAKIGAYSTTNQNVAGYVSELMIFKFGSAEGGALGHTEVLTPGKAATCTEDGLTDGSTCSVCGEVILEQKPIPATGHQEVDLPGKDATCTEDGLTAGKKCSVCETVTLLQDTIPATGHSPKEFAGSDATCTQPGMSAGTVCETCGISLSNQETTPALGHDYKYASNNNGTHTVTCSRGDLEEIAECTYLDGFCEFCGYAQPSEEPEGGLKDGRYVIAANVDGVYYAMPNIFASKMDGTKISVTDGKVTEEDAEGYVIELKATDSGWTISDGKGNYLKYNSSTNLASTTTAYVWNITEGTNGTWRVASTATPSRGLVYRAGSTNKFGGYAFSNVTSGSTEYFDIELLPVGGETAPECTHEVTTVIAATEATCVIDGNTEGVICVDCGVILSGCDPIPALGHDFSYLSNDNGFHTATCGRCGLAETQECTYEDGACKFCGYSDAFVEKDIYEKATDIAVGDTVVLVYEPKFMELSGISTTTTKYGIGASYENNGYVAPLMPLEVVQGSQEGTFAFKNGSNYLYYNSGNSLDVSTSITDKSSWTVTFDTEGNAIITNVATTSRIIRWNNTSPRFACYTSGQADVQLYKQIPYQPSCAHENTSDIPATDATCTTDGCTAGVQCNDCGEILSGCEPIPATGHNIEYGECTNCDYVVPIARPGRYVIAAKVDGVYYAMANTFSTKISGTPITFTDGMVYADDVKDYVIQLEIMDEGFGIRLADGTYLGYPGSGTDLTNPQDAYRWVFTEGEMGTWRVTSSTKEDRALVYSAGTGKFGGYSTSNIKPDGSYYDIELIPVEYDALLTYHSLSLDGNIAIHYYMALSDRVLNMENAYMRFTFEDNSHVDIPVANAEALTRRGTTTYRFNCEVSAKEMTEVIRARFFYGDNSTEEDIYSVTTYTDSLLERLTVDEESIRDNQLLINLLERMLYYGAESQRYFAYNTDRFADEGLAEVNYSAISLSGFDINRNQGTALVKFAGASLLLKSETTLRLFFTVDPSVAESFSISYNGTALTAAERSGKYYVDVTGIVADRLDEYVTVTVTDGTGAEAAVQYYPLSYCVSVASNANGIYKEDLIRVVKALYLYNQAANNYFDEV